MSTLSNVTVSFTTSANTSGKDGQTLITFTLYDSNRNPIATQPDFGNVVLPGDGKPSVDFDIKVTYPTDSAFLNHGSFSFDVEIKPPGDCTWVFVPNVTLTFLDGSKMNSVAYSPRVCNQDGPTSTFVF